MKKTTEPNVEIGTSAAPEMFYIKILADGPYLVYGNPPIDQEIIMPNEDGASWVYKKGRHYKTEGEYTALCRCGESCKKPFCDGSHSKADWNPEETSDKRPLLEDAEEYIGPTMVLADWPIMRNIVLLLVFVMHTVVSGILYRLRKLKMK